MSLSATPQSLPHTAKGRRTRERILDTAEALFAQRGYAGTTLRDVAELAGLRIPSLYNHFASKEALYESVLERGIAPLADALAEYVVAGEERPDAARFAARTLAILARRPNVPKLVQHEMLTGGDRLTPVLERWVKPAFARAEEILQGSSGARQWSADQIPLLLIALYHVVIGTFTTAPLYEVLGRGDLVGEDALGKQMRFFGDLVSRLLPDA